MCHSVIWYKLTAEQAIDYANLREPHEILDICTRTLVQLDSQGQLRFVHPSVGHYLGSETLRAIPDLQQFHQSKEVALEGVANRCLEYLEEGKRGPFLRLLGSVFVHVSVKPEHGMCHNKEHPVYKRALDVICSLGTRSLFYSPRGGLGLDEDAERRVQTLDILIQRGMFHLALNVLERSESAQLSRDDLSTILPRAMSRRDEALVVKLLEMGADPTAQDETLGTTLYVACAPREYGLFWKKDIRMLKSLLSQHPDLNKAGGVLGTPLQRASFHGGKEVVSLLLEAGADVNTLCGIFGDALQAASATGRGKVVEILLANGAQLNGLRGCFGSARLAAKMGCHTSIERLLTSQHFVNSEPGQAGRLWQEAFERANSPSGQLESDQEVPQEIKDHITSDIVEAPFFVREYLFELSSMQRFTLLVHHLATPLPAIQSALKAHSEVVESGLMELIEDGFNRGREFQWDGKPRFEECHTTHAPWKHFFRAGVHAYFIEVKCTPLAPSTCTDFFL